MNQAKFRMENVIKRKGDKLCEMSYFPEPCTHSKNKIKAELDLSNYTTKFDLKSEKHNRCYIRIC